MALLARQDKALFVGQSVRYPGHAMFNTLEEAEVSMEQRIELPVAEEMQLGFCTGLALEGFIPISIFPRMDFLILAMNQLVNHLDKIEEMSCGQFIPRVIIRTMIGSTHPLNPGPQHCQDHTEALKLMLNNIGVVRLTQANEVLPAYTEALNSLYSTIIVEIADLYTDE